ncbi:MAG: hypothetical protein DMG76_18875 [Acidobacteria bacterium]|nr:MAG: hypothetical protein DMG76_18875 [Acidobacteriota bacterium]
MNEAFCNVISEGDEARRDLFVTTAGRMGTAVQYVEKDFWVCWTLDALFHGLRAGAPRLLFKGGTSLSKSFGLINRFSEDIDITVFRKDLAQAATVEDLEALSGKKRKAKLDAIKTACQAFIKGPLRDDLRAAMRQLVSTARIPEDAYRIEVDRDDPDEQSLLFWYPTVTAAAGQYVRSAVKVEGGGKSALDPNLPTTIKPYVNDDLPSSRDLSATTFARPCANWCQQHEFRRTLIVSRSIVMIQTNKVSYFGTPRLRRRLDSMFDPP